MSLAKTTATCPFCRETIAAGATRCKHCQSDLGAAKRAKTGIFSRYNSFRYGFLAGVVFTGILIILIYFQFAQD